MDCSPWGTESDITEQLSITYKHTCVDFFNGKIQVIMEKKMATDSSTLAWRIPWTEEPGGLPSMGSQRVRHE